MAKIRSIIIALIILGVGIFLIQRIGEYFLAQPGLPAEVGGFSDLIAGMRGMTNLILMGIGVLVVLLVIVAIVRKAQARRAFKPAPPPEIPETMARMEERAEEEAPAEEREEAPPEETEEREEEELGEGGVEEEK